MRLLVVFGVAAVLAAPAFGRDRPSFTKLESEIVCPVCKPETLDQSDSAIAVRMKAFIKQRIAAGDSEAQIKSKLVAQFGQDVLASPPRKGFNLLAWWLPIAGIVAGAAVLGFGGIAMASVELAKIVFFVAILLFLIAAVFGALGGRRPVL